MINFSIIICTYNPNREIFQRLLNALLQFDISSPEHEVIIVDNNSNPALNENELVKSFLNKKQNSKLITEKNPGLTSARIAGIKNAKYEWLIFFDDDNEPDINYLKDASNAIAKINTVGVKETSRLISRIRNRQFGVLVTTSAIASDAYKEVRKDGHPIIFISGIDIVKILIDRDINTVDKITYYLETNFKHV